MDSGKSIRFIFILALWLCLCYLLVTRARQIDVMVIFSIVASGIIVVVPLYERYYKKKD